MDQVIAVVGPPAAGKTTLTTKLAENRGCTVFRLREHVSPSALAAASVNPDQVDWIDDLTVARVLNVYVEKTVSANPARIVLLDNFPGSALQVRLLLSVLGRLAPGCGIAAVELQVAERVRQQRAAGRRVCHACEHDPVHDPRLPATASSSDPWRCARCGGILHPRRGDAPRLFNLRTTRFEAEAPAMREAFTDAGISIAAVDAGRAADVTAGQLSLLIASRSLPP